MSEKLNLDEAVEITKNYQMAFYLLAAQELGISYRMLIRALLIEFSKGNKSWRIHKSLTPINDSVAMTLASYKNTCNKFLGDNGIPVPKQQNVGSIEDINTFMEKEGIQNIVVKPVKGFGGSGVTILPDTPKETENAFKYAYDKYKGKSENKVLVEEFIKGENYRLLVLGDQVIAASRRMPPLVEGDGKSSIRVLIDENNSARKAQGLSPTPIDVETEKALADQGFSLEDILSKEQKVRIRFNANLSTGGTTHECLAEVHEDYKNLAIKASKVLNLKLAGVDLITPDITDPSKKHALNEINHDPGLRIHYLPTEGEPSEVAIPIQQYILDNL
ncbi:ATP-grasp domain-containing protein [Candidatus Dojkabacteria bacterium]|nr:ATP-grasp domain-containing protein [Candidatus Dojkabacteria bacterium]